MKTSPLFLLAFFLLPFAAEAQPAACFFHFQKEGEAAFVKKRFDLARKKFAAAKECPDATGDQRRQMDARIREAEQRNLNALQVEINRAEASEEIAKSAAEQAQKALKTTEIALKIADSLRIESETITRHALANDLAFKAQVALREGDRTTAFRLLEFASKFVEPENSRVKQVLLDVFYQNDTKRPMPWCLARFDVDDGISTDYEEFTDDGKFLFVLSFSGTLRLFELATGLEVFHLKTPTEIEVISFASDASAIAWMEPGQGIQLVNPLQTEKMHLGLENSNRGENILHLEFLPDNQTLLASWADGTVISWNVKTEKSTTLFEGNGKPVWGGHLSENEKWLLLPGFDSQVRVINTVTGKLESTLQLDNPYVLTIAHSPDYQEVAIATADGHIEIWNMLKAEKRLILAPPGSVPATSLDFSLDGKTMTATFQNNYFNESKNFSLVDGREVPIEMGSEEDWHLGFIQSPSGKKQMVVRFSGFIELINYETGKHHKFPIPGSESVAYYEFSPDERFAFISYYSGAADIRDVESGRLLYSLPAAGEISTIAFSADNRQFSIARLSGEIEVWPFEFGGQLFPEKLGGFSLTGTFSPDSRLFAAPFSGDSVMVFETDFGRLLYSLSGEGELVKFSPDGQKLVVFSERERPAIFIHDASTGQLKHQLSYHPWIDGSFQAINISPDSRQLTVFSNHAEAMVFNLETGEKLPGLEGCTFVAFSPDNRWAAELRDGATTLRIINRQTGEVLFSETDPEKMFTNIAFSPDSTRLMARYRQNGGLLIWKLQPQATPLQHNGYCLNAPEFIKWSPDSKQLYQADGIYKTMDAETGKEKAKREADSEAKISRLSPDGTKALLTLKGDKCMVRDAHTGRDLFPLVGHSKFISALHFSPDSKWILTTSWDATARIWDAQTGRQQFILKVDTFPMTGFEMAPDGKKLVIWQGNLPRIWHLDPETMFDRLSDGDAKAVLSARQLYNFNLEEAFRSDDDFKKILAGWSPAQALEGAEFFFHQAELSNQPARFELQYRRSEALFQSVMNRRDKGNLNAQLFELYGRWMEKELQFKLFAGAKKRAVSFKKMREIADDHTDQTRIRTFQADWLTGEKEKAKADAKTLARSGNWNEVVDALRLVMAGEENQEAEMEYMDSYNFRRFLGDALYQEADMRLDTFSTEFSNREDYFAWQSETARLDLGKSLAENLHYGSSGELSRSFGNLAFHLLFEKKWDESARLSGYALAIDSSQIWVWTNMAHAYLFAGQTEKAKTIYQKWKDETYPEVTEDGQQQTFGPIFLKDFEEFATEKITQRDLPAMVELVSGNKLSKEERKRFSGQK